ncbi:MAG: SpoIID/LytB domain-containing protein [Lawsonibacter sp.]|nr:SpoIID/LytB domain-containing protein [Lawsonibacter sp.]
MHKRMIKFAAAALALCLTFPTARAVNTNQNGEMMIRVGLASTSTHVPTGELEAAHLQNEYGAGYRFGYYDSNLNFVELARTGRDVEKAAVLKTENLYYGKSSTLNKYTYSTSISSDILVGCVHIQLPGNYGSYAEAAAVAAGYDNGFVAWIDGRYQVRVGAYSTGADARAAQSALGGIGSVVGTSAYGMSVVETGTSRVLFQYDNGASGALAILPDVTGAEEVQTWFSGFKYRGGFQYQRRTGGNLTVVNVLSLENYINGVVCYEMGRDWSLEALKTQAVCARTYVLKNLGKHESNGFDICPSDSCQVYHGMGSDRTDWGPSETSKRAVAETAGMVVKYNGKLAEVFYVSSFGGASEDAKNIWGTDTISEYPYLRGVVDPYEADLDSVNTMSPWTVNYTAAQLTQQLQSQGMGKGTSVSSLELTYSQLGNVLQVVVHWANGQSNTIGVDKIRSRFNVRSIRFTVNGVGSSGSGTPDTPGNSSEVYINGSAISGVLNEKYAISSSGAVSKVAEKPYVITGTGSISAIDSGNKPNNTTGTQPGSGIVTVSGSTYTFNGGGWGHQVGMSQFGANAMARRGFTYDQIVTFYFPGVQVIHY